MTLIADRAYGQEESWWRYVEDEWKQDLIEHRANPPHIHLPVQFRGLGGVEQWRVLISAYFQPGQVEMALCIIAGESAGDPNADNPTSSARGLFQVLARIWVPYFGLDYDDLYDPETNVRTAYEIYRIQGWQAWTVYNRGLCQGL